MNLRIFFLTFLIFFISKDFAYTQSFESFKYDSNINKYDTEEYNESYLYNQYNYDKSQLLENSIQNNYQDQYSSFNQKSPSSKNSYYLDPNPTMQIKDYYQADSQSNQGYLDIYNNNLLKKNKVVGSKKFNDNKGIGYRVYDNSNRQSYFCNLKQENKPKFTHDNNFNGLYFGVGVNSGNLSMEIAETQRAKTTGSVSTEFSPFNVSGNFTKPSIVMGQGRLFSSGLFLGQEMSIVIGEISLIGKDFDLNPKTDITKTKTSQLKKSTFRLSNFSFYSGKFGVNIFKRYLPYLKLGISLAESKIINEYNEGKKTSIQGDTPIIVFGGGIDISLYDHVRLVIDHSIFNIKSDSENYVTYTEYSSKSSNSITINISRINLLWRF